jgi:TonB family protein
MTLTIKNTPDLNSPSNPGASSQNPEKKPDQSPRSNPVCLEVGITIRSLPSEAGGLTQPIREEGRTVIVFDNGAVLKTTNNLPVGQTVILSNPEKRDVVCRVVGGRNLPNIKGYVEIEFIEPVQDFWHIHEDAAPVSPPPASAGSLAIREAAPPLSPVTPVEPTPLAKPVKPAKASLGSGPTFEDIPGLLSKPISTALHELNSELAGAGAEKLSKSASHPDPAEIANPASVTNWRLPVVDLPAEKHLSPAASEDSLTNSSAPARPADFLSKGLTAYEQPHPSSKRASGRTPLIVGFSTLVLAFAGGVIYFMHRGTVQVSVAIPQITSSPSTSQSQPANGTPEPAPAHKEETSQARTETQPPIQSPARPAFVDQAQSRAAVTPIPAAATVPTTTDIRIESRPAQSNVRSQEKSASANKQVEPSTPQRPTIPNLKLGSPSAPKRNLSNVSDGAAPMTDIASPDVAGGSTPAGLLTSAGGISNLPTPPGSATASAPVSAPSMVRDAVLISSTLPVYPASAKQSNIQGIVTISASVDENGNVIRAKAMGGPILLRQAAVDAVKLWKYSPRVVDGKPSPSQVNVGVDFKLK